MHNLLEWIRNELNERGWDQAELARRANITQAQISRVMSGTRNPGPEFCNGIARAFNIPPERVFRLAGFLPSYPEDLDRNNIAQLLEFYRGLSYEERLRLVEHARWVYERERARKRAGK